MIGLIAMVLTHLGVDLTPLASEADLHDMYRRFAPAVRARCRAVCGNEADADEALQLTFIKAWQARARFDGRRPLAWLQVIGRNTSLELLRKRRPWTDDPAVWLKLPDQGSRVHADRVDVERLLGQFNEEDATLLRLRYAEGWRIKEIAEHLGTSQRTLRRRLERVEARARAVLKLPPGDGG